MFKRISLWKKHKGNVPLLGSGQPKGQSAAIQRGKGRGGIAICTSTIGLSGRDPYFPIRQVGVGNLAKLVNPSDRLLCLKGRGGGPNGGLGRRATSIIQRNMKSFEVWSTIS